MTQLTLLDFMKKVNESDLYQQREDESFPDYMERMKMYENFYKFFNKETK